MCPFKRQHNHRKNIVERHCAHDHQRSHRRASVHVLDERQSHHRCAAAERRLHKSSPHALILQKQLHTAPDDPEARRAHERAEQHIPDVKDRPDIHAGNIAEQHKRQCHLKVEPVCHRDEIVV